MREHGIDFFNIAYLCWYQEYHNNNHSDILQSYSIVDTQQGMVYFDKIAISGKQERET